MLKRLRVWMRGLAENLALTRLKKIPPEIMIGLAVSLITIFFFSLGSFSTLEALLYDFRFELKPHLKPSPRITVMEIDDDSLKQIGRWPWRRNVYAEALDAMRVLGARQVIFDVEFTEASARTIGQQDMVELPRFIRNEFDALSRDLGGLKDALGEGRIANPSRGLTAFEENLNHKKEGIVNRLSQFGENDDLAFQQAIARHGEVVIPIRCYNESNALTPAHSEVLASYGIELANPLESMKGVLSAKWLDIPAPPLHRGARRLAFTNVDTDEDGVRRRIALFREFQGKLFPQLAIAGLLGSGLEGEGGVSGANIEFYPGSHALLKGILLPDEEEPIDLKIPLDERGQMLINWAGTWNQSFNRFSFSDLFALIEAKKELRQVFVEVDNLYFGDQGGLTPLVKRIDELTEKALSGADLDEAELLELRGLEDYVLEIGTNELAGMVESLPQQEPEAQEILSVSISNVRRGLDHYLTLETKVSEGVRDAFVIIGQTASSTTDLGTTPLGINQPQVFLHANTLNTILNHSFIHTLPKGIEYGLILLIPVVFGFYSQRLKPSLIIILGSAFLLIVFVINQFVFGAGIWMQLAPLGFALVATFLIITGLHYIQGDKEKKYIKNAFGHYLSPDVIEFLVKDPSALKLGGERRVLTALFSDVQGFSSISENLSPEELVELLNAYLSDMTDIVLSCRGTVDKFEGDAIMAFYGAPVGFDDHARQACLSALKMQSHLDQMRAEWKARYGHELYMRIGINSGPMVVGNMGSRKRFDYTVMGDAVNLAARLEGVNKFYKCFTMASEFTVDELGSEVITRELDILRVVGKSEPVRVYELVALQGEMDAKKANLLEIFSEGLQEYRKKNWARAQKQFKAALALDPDDGPSLVYQERCAEFRKKAPPPTWDGVYTLKSK